MENKKIFDREEHFCPYNKNASCSGWSCGTDCPIHPDYEDEYDSELEKELDEAYSAGWDQGYKKGYIAAMEDEDTWVEDEDENSSCACPCGLDCCEFNDYTLDASDCEGCEFNLGDLEDEDLENLEALYQAGELEPDIAKAYDMGKNYGYNLGLSEGSSIAEENYALGYKECLVGNPPCIYDEELEELLEQENSFEDYDKSVPAGIDIDTDIEGGRRGQVLQHLRNVYA